MTGPRAPERPTTAPSVDAGAAGGLSPAEPKSFLGLVEELYSRPGARGARWRVETGGDLGEDWIRVGSSRPRTAEQGWKLHISAGVWSAETVLRRALPVLLGEDAPFKIAASPAMLEQLNLGYGGPSQIGKFVTVYPHDDAQAVRLAVTLDEATRGLGGPPVPSDRPLGPGSLVHYRYGAFGGRAVQTPMGEILPAIRSPDGELVADLRLTAYRPPEWVDDPFEAAGVVTALGDRGRVVKERFAVLATLYRSPRAEVHLALDLIEPRRCVLKQARNEGGSGARHRLYHEADVLRELAPDARFPAVLDVFEDGDDVFLALEDVEGPTLEEHVGTMAARGRLLSGEEVASWGRELSDALGAVHARGLAYRDLKSANVVAAPDGRLRLLDFDLAHPLGSATPPHGQGTVGYMSPQQLAGEPPAVTDDVYGLGAVLYFAATSAEPSQAPRRCSLLDRPVEQMNPAVGASFARVIESCLDPDPRGRYQTMSSLSTALTELGTRASATPPPLGAASGEDEAAARRRCRELAGRLGETLRRAAHPTPDGRGMSWTSSHLAAGEMFSRDLNTGTAGTLLALAELVAELGDPHQRRLLAQGAVGLETAPRPEGPPLPGLYVGEAGVAAALLRAGQVLRDEAVIELAVERGRWIASLPHASPDLFNGTAGRLRLHLLLWDETSEAESLEHALAAGERLLEAAEGDDGAVRWTFPAGYGGLSGRAFLGYAHGAAGIADALLDLFDATEDDRFRSAAVAAARWLLGLGVETLDDDTGLDWPPVAGAELLGPYWCHGASGVGRFLLHVAAVDGLPGAEDAALRAARTVARGSHRDGPTQCHGLAGKIEFLLDVFQATRDRAYLAEARRLGALLEAHATERDGHLVWPSDSPSVFTPDYAVGYGGVAVCLLRLSDPERLPHQLSRRGFSTGRLAAEPANR